MSGFGNIGTGLAGFMQGYQNSQREAAQRALQQQALQQLQFALAGQRLLATTTFGGGINGTPTPQPPAPGQASVPSFPQGGGGGGAPPIPPAPTAPPPPVPQAPVDPDPRVYDAHLVYATPGQPQPFGDDTPIPPQPMQGEMVDDRRMIGRETLAPPEAPEPAGAAPASKGLQQPLSEEEYQRQYPDGIIGPPGGFHTPAGSATTTPTPSGSAGPGGGGTEQASAAGGSSANSSLFQQLLDPNHAYKALGEMRDRIAAAAPPGTDPAVIWEATQQLYKLTNGGAMERAQLAAALKATGLDVKQQEGALNRGARSDIVDKQLAGRSDIVDKQIGARSASDDKKIAAGQAKEEFRQKAVDARQADRMAYKKQQDAANRGDKETVQRLSRIRAEISAQAQLLANAPTSAAQKAAQKKLQELSAQIEQMGPSGTVGPPLPAPSQ